MEQSYGNPASRNTMRAAGGTLKNGAAIGGGGNTYQITVQTGVGDPRQIGEQVVSYIKRFEAASGPVFARA